jgi:hypothetical protein
MNAQLSQDDLSVRNAQMQAGIIVPPSAAILQLAAVEGKAVALGFDSGLLSFPGVEAGRGSNGQVHAADGTADDPLYGPWTMISGHAHRHRG